MPKTPPNRHQKRIWIDDSSEFQNWLYSKITFSQRLNLHKLSGLSEKLTTHSLNNPQRAPLKFLKCIAQLTNTSAIWIMETYGVGEQRLIPLEVKHLKVLDQKRGLSMKHPHAITKKFIQTPNGLKPFE